MVIRMACAVLSRIMDAIASVSDRQIIIGQIADRDTQACTAEAHTHTCCTVPALGASTKRRPWPEALAKQIVLNASTSAMATRVYRNQVMCMYFYVGCWIKQEKGGMVDRMADGTLDQGEKWMSLGASARCNAMRWWNERS